MSFAVLNSFEKWVYPVGLDWNWVVFYLGGSIVVRSFYWGRLATNVSNLKETAEKDFAGFRKKYAATHN